MHNVLLRQGTNEVIAFWWLMIPKSLPGYEPSYSLLCTYYSKNCHEGQELGDFVVGFLLFSSPFWTGVRGSARGLGSQGKFAL